MRLPPALRAIGSPAMWGLRTYWGTSLILVAAGSVALVAILPVTRLLGLGGVAVDSRLAFSTVGRILAAPGWGAATRTPAATQQQAIGGLFEVLVGAMGAVAVVAAVTLVSLFGARASARAPEVTARRAVGASRRRLVASGLLESSVLACGALLFGGAAGALLARLAEGSWPGTLSAGIAGSSGWAAGGVAFLMVFGSLLPFVFARQRRIVETPAKPLELVVPAVQLGLSLIVLTAGAILAKQATRGLERSAPASGEVFRAALADDSAPGDRAGRYAALLEELSAGGEFDTVSLTSTGTLAGLGTISVVTTDCGECSEGGIYLPWHLVSATHQFVSADSFHALGVRLVAGRGITAADLWRSTPVAVVSRGLALRHFQRGEAIGRKILLGDDARTWHTVVGIVDDPPAPGLGATLQPRFTVYASVLQHPVAQVDLLLRSRRAAAIDMTVVATVRRALGLATQGPVRVSELLAAETLPLRWFARWFGFEGWAALALACGGTFALMRLWVLSLLVELGLRRAVGARRSHLLGFVLVRAAGVGLAGVAVGLWFGPAVWAALGSVVSGLPTWDAATVTRFAAILVAAAVAGALPPAWRAARSTPATLLAWS